MADVLAAALDELDAAAKDARATLESSSLFRDNPRYREAGYRALVQASAMAHNIALASNLESPQLQAHWHPCSVFAIGQNCPDFRYGFTLLDGRRRYRLHGRLGNLKLLLVQVHDRVLGHPDAREIGNYDLHDFADDNGQFDLVLSAEPDDGPWIKLDAESVMNYVVVRQILGNIDDDAGQVRISPIADDDVPERDDPDLGAERFRRAADLLRYVVRAWCVNLHGVYVEKAGGRNRLGYIPGETISSDLLGSPSTTYGVGVYDFEQGECAIVEWEPAESAYWSFHVGDVWSSSFDFINHQSHINMTHAVLDEDRRFRAVICDVDPGVPNWIDTCGWREGLLLMRNYRAKGESIAPTMRKVRLDVLRRHLPEDTAHVTARQRERALARRREGFLRAYDR